MKILVIALIIWQGGSPTQYVMESEAACIDLTLRLAPYVESADCLGVEE